MDESLTMRRRVSDEGPRVVKLNPQGNKSRGLIPHLSEGTLREALANSVPAAAVIRRGQALFGITGHKGHVGGSVSRFVKAPGSTGEVHPKLPGLRPKEECGTLSGAVKCVDIQWNAGGESDTLVRI